LKPIELTDFLMLCILDFQLFDSDRDLMPPLHFDSTTEVSKELDRIITI